MLRNYDQCMQRQIQDFPIRAGALTYYLASFLSKTVLKWKQECIPVGCVPSALYRTGGLCPGGFCPGGLCPGGVSVRETPSPRRQTYACETWMHSSRMRTTRSSSHPGGGGGSPPGTPPGSRHPPPCGQNHRRLWKYNLAPTSLRAVNITLPLRWRVVKMD